VKVKEIIRLIEQDGWFLSEQKEVTDNINIKPKKDL
jgi:hypothetical protein